ncbi:MAG: sigma-70 family RNA polymerase sigma factor [Acidobacteria bacterium]|nr:MAG: sigma-70 family RNA polymerase sigma factor [Acidobacteriota bacterium]REK05903.1 MAG: sigma-70 family RNA polymerase sigma factor [Acidobacteriota bacterium]
MSTSTSSPEQLFVDSLPLIERLLRGIAHRYCLRPEEAEEFAAQAKLKLVEDDYRRIREFSGRSKLSTYLRVVLTNLFRDFRIEKWGKYRVSKAAQRLGRPAILLDRLVRRDRRSEYEALQIVLQRPDVEASEAELEAMLLALPQRSERREETEPDEFFHHTPSSERTDRRVEEAEQSAALRSLRSELAAALAELADEDRLILMLRFFEGVTVADIARRLDLEQRPLYRRIESTLAELRGSLIERGVGADAARALLADAAGELALDPPSASPAGGAAPSTGTRATAAPSPSQEERP